MENEVEKLEEDIDNKLALVMEQITLINNSRTRSEEMSREVYVWLVYAYDIFFQVKDINLLLSAHKKGGTTSYSAVYAIFRSVLEQYFYLKLLFADRNKLHTNLLALMLTNTNKNKKHLTELQKLAGKNMFILSKNPDMVISAEGMQRKISKYESDISNFKLGRDVDEVERLSKVYKSVISVCEEYDKVKGITNIEDGNESKSLVWQYHYIYRFLSGSVHGRLEHKETNFDILWSKTGDSKPRNYLEVLSFVSLMLGEIIEMAPSQ